MPVLAASPITKKTFRKPAPEEAPMLSKSVIIGALKYADKVEGTSHMIPHEKVMDEIYRRRGWSK